jgi:cytochrome c oxidase cbb3-type subunit III
MCSPFRSASSRLTCCLLAGFLLTCGSGCQRSKRTLLETAPMSARSEPIAGGRSGANNRPTRNPYEDNAYAMTEGQRLYDWYNCTGCHARGGGGIGPPLMADVWRYGKDPGNIYASIVDGRPNGMPSWRGKMPQYQVWQIVTYLQTLEANRGIAAPPGPRQEHMQAGEGAESR